MPEPLSDALFGDNDRLRRQLLADRRINAPGSAIPAIAQITARRIPTDFGPREVTIKRTEIELNPAKWTFERLVRRIEEFEARITNEQELGGTWVGAPRGPVHITDLGYWGPDLIEFHGVDADGNPFHLIQHHTQVNVMLCAVA